MLNLDNKIFVTKDNSNNGEVSNKTTFYYHQNQNIVWAEYSGGSILSGHLIATMDSKGNLDMRYHHVNIDHKLMTGVCSSVPVVLDDGRIRFNESWKWTSGNLSTGHSIIEEKK